MRCKLCGKRLPLGVAECDNCGMRVEWKKYLWLTAGVTALVVALAAGMICGMILTFWEENVAKTEPSATAAPTETMPEPTQTEPTEGSEATEPTETPTEQPTQPPTEPTEAPTEPIDPGPHASGDTFVYEGPDTWLSRPNADLSECEEKSLYYVDWLTAEVFLVTSESVTAHCNSDYMVYYVKASEPMRIYGSPKFDLTQNWVVYETDFGEINYVSPGYHQYRNSTLEIVEGNKRFVLHDLATGLSSVKLEMYYIAEAHMGGDPESFDGDVYFVTLDIIWFSGKLDEEEKSGGNYVYDCQTGEIKPGYD